MDDNSANSIWSSGVEKSEFPWLQLKLEEAKKVASIEIVTRQDFDQPQTRANFEVRASDDVHFSTYTVLGKQGATPLPYKSTWSVNLKSGKLYKYIRIAKTAQEYFTIAEVRLLSAK